MHIAYIAQKYWIKKRWLLKTFFRQQYSAVVYIVTVDQTFSNPPTIPPECALIFHFVHKESYYSKSTTVICSL